MSDPDLDEPDPDVPSRPAVDGPALDVLIVGGGLVGASLACALEGSGLRVALAEATAGAAAGAPSFDERNLALARASRNALTTLGVWRHLAGPASPIERIHVSSRGDFGAVRLRATDYGLDAFGAVVVARELGAALETRLAELRDVERLRPARVIGIEPGADAIRVQLQREGAETTLATRLLVAADGTESSLRTALGIAVEREDYHQTLFVATVELGKPHAQEAFERFTEHGPVALLPLAGTRCGSILTVPAAQADAVVAMDDDAYRALLQERFGWRLGRLGRIGRRSAYPLQRVCATRLTAPRAVLVGNAAQTIHPIGAQGFNLGLRDALTLAEELEAAVHAGGDAGDPLRLQRYAARRQADRAQTMGFSDGLLRLFAHTAAPVRALRSLGLMALDRVPGLNDGLVSGAMGFRGDVPRHARDGAA
jgi:2-octaprenyl-6-methoxyphenol hydroxylase